MKDACTLVFLAVSVAGTCSVAFGSIIATAGMAMQIAPPPSALYTALPGPPAFCWDE